MKHSKWCELCGSCGVLLRGPPNQPKPIICIISTCEDTLRSDRVWIRSSRAINKTSKYSVTVAFLTLSLLQVEHKLGVFTFQYSTFQWDQVFFSFHPGVCH